MPGPGLPAPPNGTNPLRNSSLELDTDADHAPDCWEFDPFGNNSVMWARTTDAHTGTYAERVDVTNYSSGDDKLIVENDLGDCSPTVTPGRQYRLTTWYKSSVPVSFVVFRRDSQWAFGFWLDSPTFPATSSWAQATWITPVIPSGTNGLAFGLALEGELSLGCLLTGWGWVEQDRALRDVVRAANVVFVHELQALGGFELVAQQDRATQR